ncbi:nucleoside triphosphate pyrophosphohydrolase [Nocardioides mangrovicus]|uniref:Nucleoside triphosphate pyrophosphohydrolase n=2 Tax=Nocardioides mangrovicus TaxID=2478913 RepID=A0A3L8P7P3_9ACTN|nr:nucleoside triphosphate pyrophosphohydrolase [Nocardioides mangrovicus]
MARLRAQCPWKQQQTHRSLARYLLEETHETLEAIESGDAEHLREELGDLLLQVYFHAAIAAEAGEYDIEDVAADLRAKLIRRNPHVFGDAAGEQRSVHEVNEAWEHIKRAEKQREHPTDGLPGSLPALLWADKVIDRMGRDGRPVAADPASTELGERLLALAVEAHAAGVDAEQALRDAVRHRLAD